MLKTHSNHPGVTMLTRTLFTVIFFILFAPQAMAQATRTWVSGVGDDANPCSRTAPCKTFAGAISKTAASGEIDALDSGGFGSLTITKAITIDGGAALAGVLVAGTNAIIVNAGINDQVILRNLDINGLGPTASAGLSGISFLGGKRLIVENVKIYGFSQNGINIAPTTMPTLGNVEALIDNVTISQIADPDPVAASAAGIRVAPGGSSTVDATIANVQITGSDKGIAVQDGGLATISRAVTSNNRRSGIAANGAGRPTQAFVENSVSTGNASGVRASAATVILSSSLVSRNQLGLDVSGGGLLYSYGNNRVTANTTPGAPSAILPAN